MFAKLFVWRSFVHVVDVAHACFALADYRCSEYHLVFLSVAQVHGASPFVAFFSPLGLSMGSTGSRPQYHEMEQLLPPLHRE